MTVTSTAYTTSSVKIAISGELVSNNIIAAVNTALTSAALGTWSLYDGVAPSAISSSYATTGFSPIWTNVYRVLNTDASTYKYFIIRYDTIKNLFYTSTCESWNNSTHVSTNESWTGGGVFPQYYDVRDSFIMLSASTKHCVIWPFIKNEPGMWSGVFEFERIATEDLASNTVPCFAWTNSLMLGTPYGRPAANTGRVMFAFPRTPDGATGAAAAQQYSPITNRGMYPPSYPSATALTVTEPNMLHLGSYFNLAYGWDPTKTVASPIAADAQAKSMPFGRMYNAGITKSVGNFLDTTYLNLDATGGWPDATGSNTEVLLLPLNGGSEANAQSGAQLTYSYAFVNSTPVGKTFAIGSTQWAAANDGVRVWSTDSGILTPTTQILSGQVITDIVFDGQDNVYAAGGTAVYRIQASNTSNQTSVALPNATSNGAAYLALDNNYLYVSSRSVNTAPICFTLPRNNFLSANLGTYTLATTLANVATNFGTPTPDYNGYVYVATTPGSVTVQIPRIAVFQANTAAQIANANNPIRSTSTNAALCYSNFWVDNTSGRVFLFAADGTASAGSIYETNTALTTISTTQVMNTSPTAANAYSGLTYLQVGDLRGDLVVQPIRGLFHVQPKRASGNSSATWSNKINLISPQSNVSIGAPERVYSNIAGQYFTDAGGSFSGIITHNGPRTYYSDCNSITNNNVGFVRNYYSLNNINGAATGRITVKA